MVTRGRGHCAGPCLAITDTIPVSNITVIFFTFKRWGGMSYWDPAVATRGRWHGQPCRPITGTIPVCHIKIIFFTKWRVSLFGVHRDKDTARRVKGMAKESVVSMKLKRSDTKFFTAMNMLGALCHPLLQKMPLSPNILLCDLC